MKIFWSLLLATMLVLIPLAICADEPANVCPNPGFELGGGPGGPAGWEGSEGAVKWDDEVVHSGKRSVRVTSEGERTVGGTSDLIPVPRSLKGAGPRFVFEGWAKLENVSGEKRGVLLVLYTIGEDGNRNGQTAMIPITPPSGDSLTLPWTQYVSLSDVLKPEVHYVRVNVRLYGAKGTVWFDDISVRPYESAELTAPRQIRYDMRFVKDGKPCAAIVPATEGKGCADQVQKAIEDATGATLPIEQPSSINMAQEKRDLILLGNLETSPCVEYLYLRSYTYEDRYFPGAGGYVIRPLFDPLGTGANFLIIGASNEAGLNNGVEEICKLVQQNASKGELAPKLALTVRTGEGYKGTRYFPWIGSPPRRELGPAAEYLKSGQTEFARAYRDMVFQTFFIPDEKLFSEDAPLHLRYVSKTQSWDLMETSGAFTDQERLRVTKRLLDMMRSPQGYEYSGLRSGMFSRENHGIRAATGFYFGWRYFKKYYARELGPELDMWEKRLREFWKAPFASSRSYEDSLSQHAFAGSLDNTLTVGLCEPEWSREFFEKSYPRRMGERCIAVCDNLGEVVQQGDTSASDYPADVFAKLAYRFRDGRYLYMLRKRGAKGSSSDDPFQGYVVNLEPKEPTDHVGVRVIPADPLFYSSAYAKRPNVPIEKAFDKLTFRAGFDEEDAYLMLDGTAGGSHSYDDVNTIGEFSQHGRIWLCQVDQFNGPTMSFHNGVTVAHDGLGQIDIPPCAELITACQGANFGYTATALRDYNGVDWVRHVFWLKKEFFFVLDELRAREEGEYSFVCSWRGLGEPRLEAGLYSASTDASHRFFLGFPPHTPAGMERDTEVLGPYLNPHRWHDKALNVVTQSRSRQLKPGDSLAFQNMFWSVRDEEKKFKLLRLNECSALVHTSTGPVLVGGGEGGAEVKLDGLRVSAQFFCVDAEGYILVGPSLLRIAENEVPLPSGKEFVEGSWADDATRKTISELLSRSWESARKTAAGTETEGGAKLPGLDVRWSNELPAEPLCLTTRASAGQRSIAVGGADGVVREFQADGTPMGTFKTGGPVHTLCSCDLDGDGVEELLVGSDDERVYALDGEMKPLWKHQVPFLREEQYWMWWTLGSSKVRKIYCDDLDGDGSPEIIIGAGNMRLNAINSKGESLWRFRTDHGIPTTIITADIFGKGKRSILCGNGQLSSNGTCWALSEKGKALKAFYNDSWCTTLPAIAAGDPDGDGKTTVFCGNNRGNLRAYDPKGSDRKPLWIHNLGGPIRRIVVLPATGAEPGLVVAASDSGCLTAFRGDGEKAWVATLNAAVVAAERTLANHILAGCRDGTLFLVSRNGQPLASFRTGEQLQGLIGDANGNTIAITKQRLWVLGPPGPK